VHSGVLVEHRLCPRSREALGDLLRLLGMVAARYQRHYCPLRWWIRVTGRARERDFR
jgi:hypothetical protein